MQAEGVERDEYSLVHHHGTHAVLLADVGIGCVAVDGVSARQVPRVRVDGRVNRHTGTDPQHKHARYESLRSEWLWEKKIWTENVKMSAFLSNIGNANWQRQQKTFFSPGDQICAGGACWRARRP